MLLKQLNIKNIRSYQDSTINFDTGITLLAGDIGSGKTSILLAIEFAIFGILRGEVGADELLRHGTNQGMVQLKFSKEDKEYEIVRYLKRTSNGIGQDTGSLKINNQEIKLTASELKAKMLEILGYPQEYQNKSKNIIYRYTTYTPQEDVKKILNEEQDIRLDSIRKIFNIDKYKTARDNAAEISKILKRDITNKEYQERETNLKEEEETIQEQISKYNIQKSDSQKEITVLEQKNLKYREKIQELQKERENYLLQKQKVDNAKTQLIQLKQDLAEIESTKLPEEVKAPENKQIPDFKQITKKIEDTQEKLSKAKQKLAVTESKTTALKTEISQMDSLDYCPTCKQKVTQEHKQKHKKEKNTQLTTLLEQNNKLEEYSTKASNNLKKLKNQYEITRDLTEQQNRQQQRYKNYLEQKKLIEEKLSRQERIQKDIEDKKRIIATDLPNFDQTKYEEIQNKNQEIQQNLSEVRVIIATTESNINNLKQNQLKIQKELEDIQKQKTTIQQKQTAHKWLAEYFNKSLYQIESQVLNKIHAEFNHYFQTWFDMLIEDDSITSRLDDAFTPYIIQNGQKTQFKNLSGGEKTSMALSYRLALNQVISEFVSSIKTKNIIILDEPTDGFSAQQLDKLRDVLDNISAKQTIIVSHEPKLESFAERVIRIHKQGHISKVL